MPPGARQCLQGCVNTPRGRLNASRGAPTQPEARFLTREATITVRSALMPPGARQCIPERVSTFRGAPIQPEARFLTREATITVMSALMPSGARQGAHPHKGTQCVLNKIQYTY